MTQEHEEWWDAAERTLPPHFVETSVSRRIFRAADLAREIGTNAAVIGAPGVGKSMAIAAYKARRPLTATITVTPVLASSLRELLQEICARVGILPSSSTRDMERSLLKFDRCYGSASELTGNRYAVILDEAQNLPLKSIRQLLHLSAEDGGHLSFIFSGNNEILKQVNVDKGAFVQISRRVTFRETIDAITDDDADALASAYGAEGMDAFRLLRQIAARHHADGVAKVLGLASKLAQTTTVGGEDIRTAIDLLPQYRTAVKAVRQKARERAIA